MNIERVELNQLLQVIEEYEVSIPNVVNLIKASQSLPTEMTLGGRPYEILSFLEEDKQSVTGHIMVLRAMANNTYLSENDGKHILKNQAEIPKILRGKVKFLFSGWHISNYPETVYYIHWDGRIWDLDWNHLDDDFDSEFRLLRCKQKAIVS